MQRAFMKVRQPVLPQWPYQSRVYRDDGPYSLVGENVWLNFGEAYLDELCQRVLEETLVTDYRRTAEGRL